MIKKIFIANRGEIARRIIRTAHRLGLETVAIYTLDEPDALWAQEATENVFLKGNSLSETYLNINQLILAAKSTGCDAVHPGYGFLSENASFAKKCAENNLVFIGPTAETIQLMGDKLEALSFAKQAGISVPFGFEGTSDEILKQAGNMPFPVIIKASAGGGGKGMHIVYSKHELAEKLEKAQREAQTWFGNPSVYVEQYFEKARHIEVQILGDEHGKIIHLFERECTLQRNYQKIIEEAPSPTLNNEQRDAICDAAVKLAQAAKYTNAGTIEFLWADGKFYFLEMNTRIQVEHPVTEAITGVDIVEQQIHISNHLSLQIRQKDVKIDGSAIEARIYAENPSQNFKPSAGMLSLFIAPIINGVRFDEGYQQGNRVTTFYDGMLGKLITHDTNREKALSKLNNHLKNIIIHGVDTNQVFLHQLLSDKRVIQNKIYTRFIQTETMRAQNTAVEEPAYPFFIAAHLLYAIKKQENKNSIWKKLPHTPSIWNRTLFINNQPYSCKGIWQEFKLQLQLDNEMFNVSEYLLNNNSLWLVINGVEKTLWISKSEDAFWIQDNKNLVKLKNQHDLTQVQINKQSMDGNSNGNFEIKSPLHGKISTILVRKGQKVEQGANILTIESMKTENQIASPASGIVDEIFIATNSLVKENQVLVTFKN